MKVGKSLVELAGEIERQAKAKRDWVVSTEVLEMLPDGRVQIQDSGLDPFGVNDFAHGQIATHLKIPKDYYTRMRGEQPDLLAQNVNRWLDAKTEKRMIRTMDGNVRAFLSNAYRSLTYVDLAEAVLPVLINMNVQVMSAEITETKMYLKVVDERITRDIPTGRKMGDASHSFFDTVSPAMVISNSEVGCGSLSVETAVWTKVCTNLAISSQRSMRKYHVGPRAELGEEMFKMLSDDTKKKTDIALWAQVRDVVKNAFDQAQFDATVNDITGMAAQPIEGDPVKVIEVTGKYFGFQEEERSSVLRHLIEGGDLSRYGLFNAVTRTAEDLESYDRATEFERFGGQLVALPAGDWNKLATAA